MKNIFLTFAALVLFAAAAAAQTVYTPEKGSAERSLILNTLRLPVERDLKQSVIFVAENFKVQGNWAFIGGEPQTSAGGRPNYRGTKYWSAVSADMFDNNIFALLKKTGGKWKVVTYAIGCTDVCYADWWRRFRAPKAIFPYTE
jgi:hypothetical protein